MKPSEFAALRTIERRIERKMPGDCSAIGSETLATWELLDRLVVAPADIADQVLTADQRVAVDAMLGGGL